MGVVGRLEKSISRNSFFKLKYGNQKSLFDLTSFLARARPGIAGERAASFDAEEPNRCGAWK